MTTPERGLKIFVSRSMPSTAPTGITSRQYDFCWLPTGQRIPGIPCSVRQTVRGRGLTYHGSVVLERYGTPADRMAGRYWTHSNSKDELRFETGKSKIAKDREDTAALLTGGL